MLTEKQQALIDSAIEEHIKQYPRTSATIWQALGDGWEAKIEYAPATQTSQIIIMDDVGRIRGIGYHP